MSHAALLEAILADTPGAAMIMLADDPDLCVASDDPSALMLAIYRRQAPLVEAILARRRRLTVFEAAALGRTEALRRELALHPEAARAVAADGFTPLHLACFFGHSDTVAFILKAGADPDALAGNATRLRPLHSAATQGDVEVCRMLLDAGASPDATQQGGYTALHAAALRGNGVLAALLVARGASVGIAAEDGRTAANIAMQSGYLELAETLRSWPPPEWRAPGASRDKKDRDKNAGWNRSRA